MTTSFTLHGSELNSSFLDRLRSMFADKQIEILVHEQDETEYLMSNPANRARLDRAIADIEAGRNIVDVDQSPFD